jgi:hypothetical protein
MLEATTYFACLVLFSFVIYGSVYVRDEMLILACIPPFFVAAVAGFTMWIYMFETFGVAPPVIAVLLPFPLAWHLGRRFVVRDMLLAIYLAWAVGMVLALVAYSFPDAA